MQVAYSYIRFSCRQQAGGTSEIRQAEKPEDWCRRNGYTLDTTLRLKDLGKSAYHGINVSRGALGVFLALVKDGMIERGSVLLIEHLDRFTRVEPMEALDLIRDVVSHGVDVVSLIDGERYTRERLSKDFGCLLKLVLLLFQNHESSATKSYRVSKAWSEKRNKAQKKERFTSRCPSWLDPETREPIPEKVETLKTMFSLARSGQGPSRIAKQFNAEKIPPLDFGKKWSSSLVRHYLSSRLVIGELQMKREVEGVEKPEGEPVPTYYPAVIPDPLFYAVQQIIASRTKLKGRVDANKNLFAGIVHSLMGGTYNFKESHDHRGAGYVHRHLVSQDRRDGYGNHQLNIQYDSFEKAFFKLVSEIDPAKLFNPKSNKTEELEDLQGKIAELDLKIEETKAKIKMTKNASILLDLLVELDESRKTLALEGERLKAEINNSQVRIFDDLKTLIQSPENRAKISSHIRLLVERINILAVHTRTAQHKRIHYLLYTEVRFHGGYVKYLVTDDAGEIPWKHFRRRHIVGAWKSDGTNRTGTTRKEVLTELVKHASDLWKPSLEAWLVDAFTG